MGGGVGAGGEGVGRRGARGGKKGGRNESDDQRAGAVFFLGGPPLLSMTQSPAPARAHARCLPPPPPLHRSSPNDSDRSTSQRSGEPTPCRQKTRQKNSTSLSLSLASPRPGGGTRPLSTTTVPAPLATRAMKSAHEVAAFGRGRVVAPRRRADQPTTAGAVPRLGVDRARARLVHDGLGHGRERGRRNRLHMRRHSTWRARRALSISTPGRAKSSSECSPHVQPEQ